LDEVTAAFIDDVANANAYVSVAYVDWMLLIEVANAPDTEPNEDDKDSDAVARLTTDPLRFVTVVITPFSDELTLNNDWVAEFNDAVICGIVAS
jgi:hypothetical protein